MEKKLTLVQHLEELRRRIIVCLMVIFICGIFSFFYTDKILAILSHPVGELFFLKPTEAFLAKIKISFYSGILISMPVIIYHVWRFVKPGLIEIERKTLYWIVPFSYLLFVLGVLFAFFAVLPTGVKFLLSYGGENIKPMLSVSSYISFVTSLLLAFGIVFQLPLVILFLTKLGIVTPNWFAANRKYAILAIFILAAILTPGPDIFSQFLMAIPILLLYEMSIFLSKILVNKRN